MAKMTPQQQKLLQDIARRDQLVQSGEMGAREADCYVHGRTPVRFSCFRRGWIEDPGEFPLTRYVLTDAGRAALNAISQRKEGAAVAERARADQQVARPTRGQKALLGLLRDVPKEQGWHALKGRHWSTIESCLVNGWIEAFGGDGMSGLALTAAGRAVVTQVNPRT